MMSDLYVAGRQWLPKFISGSHESDSPAHTLLFATLARAVLIETILVEAWVAHRKPHLSAIFGISILGNSLADDALKIGTVAVAIRHPRREGAEPRSS